MLTADEPSMASSARLVARAPATLVDRRLGGGKSLVAGARIRPRLLKRSPTPMPTSSKVHSRRSTTGRSARSAAGVQRAEGTMPILFGTGFAHQKAAHPGRLRRVARWSAWRSRARHGQTDEALSWFSVNWKRATRGSANARGASGRRGDRATKLLPPPSRRYT